jgi:hypothetical protein
VTGLVSYSSNDDDELDVDDDEIIVWDKSSNVNGLWSPLATSA